MNRLPDWERRLDAYVAHMARTAFRPGRVDCALFTAGAVQVMTGVDLARGWRGYRTLAEGRRRLAAQKFDDPIALAASHLAEIDPIRAAPGDVAVIATPGGPALAIVQGVSIYAVGPKGLQITDRTAMLRAFAVPGVASWSQ